MDFIDLEVTTTNNTQHVATRREIHVGPDLLGQLVVDHRFRGQRRVHLVADIAEAQVVVRRSLRRRLTAPRRIGVPYRVIACHDPGGWLKLMGFLLIDDHLAIVVPALVEPINSPPLQAEYQ
jgi:hypothetical protein